MTFDAVLVLSFGGPDRPEDVRPFLANVLRGRPVPAERVEQVVAQYMLLGGRSPINGHNRDLVEALRGLQDRPVYLGNRNWKPYVTDTLRQMAGDGVGRAAVFITSAYSSYSGCRQYLDDLGRATAEVGPRSPELARVRPYFNHPGFVAPLADGLAAADPGRPGTRVLMTAHSIPEAMAAGCDYEAQLAETAGLVAERAGVSEARLVYQSRSGRPGQPWLGPDLLEVISEAPPGSRVVVTPIGFVSDHMEVVHDLDVQAHRLAAERGIEMVRTPTPGSDARFAAMAVELVEELEGRVAPRALGSLGPRAVPCRPGCCRPG